MLKPWWSEAALQRVLASLLSAELARLRPGRAHPELAQLARDPRGALDPLGLDSLERLELLTSLAVRFAPGRTDLDRRLLASPTLADWTAILREARAHDDCLIGFQTSGSTGRPRLHTLPMLWLEQEVAYFAERFADRQRVLAPVPAHHIYGFLFTVMLPAMLEIPVLPVSESLPATVLAEARAGDLIVGHPFFYELAMRAPLALAPDLVALSSTSACPPPLWERLAECGLTRLIEIHGSTETVGLGTRESASEPFHSLPWWSRDPQDASQLIRRTPEGQALAIALPDRLDWQDEDHFRLLGRRDGALQVGGHTVFPQQVQALIATHPEVAEALVRPSGAPPQQRLKAFVVPGSACRDPDTLAERLHAWLAERLGAPERPCTIRIGTRLPRSVLGKPLDWD